MSVAISAEGIGKRYRLGVAEAETDTLGATLASWLRSPLHNLRSLRSLSRFDEAESDDVMWALRDVSFSVDRGEVLGIIGDNGAGKSTLLKILSRITEPSRGRCEIRGQVASLLEVGTGFHPELTGRENVFLNGAILGMTKRDIEGRFDQIVDFSGVARYIDTPVKRYSSGMQVRLAFAVAAHLEPEILLIDEVLSVGDASFQRKSIGRMGEVARSGRTVLFVSHNLAAVTSFCDRVLRLDRGLVSGVGPPEPMVQRYLQDGLRDPGGGGGLRLGNEDLSFTAIEAGGPGEPGSALRSGAPARFSVKYEAHRPIPPGEIRALKFRISTPDGSPLFTCEVQNIGWSESLPMGAGVLTCTIDRLPLLPGEYLLGFLCKLDRNIIADDGSILRFEVALGDFFGTGKLPHPKHGRILVPHTWRRHED